MKCLKTDNEREKLFLDSNAIIQQERAVVYSPLAVSLGRSFCYQSSSTMKRGILLFAYLFLVQCSLARVFETPVPIIFPQEEVLKAMFRCDDFKYILKDKICDGIEDCADKTDEATCSHWEFETPIELLNRE
jgi:Low-density lipoprotein receptor domain class A